MSSVWLIRRVLYMFIICLCLREDGRSVDVQYSNWQRTDPVMFHSRRCVVMTQHNYWITYNCDLQQPYICQS